MCNCIKEVSEVGMKNLQDKFPTDRIDHGQMLCVSFVFGETTHMATYNDLQYQHTPRKKDGTLGKPRNKTVALLHIFCPYCGLPYDKEDGMKDVPETKSEES